MLSHMITYNDLLSKLLELKKYSPARMNDLVAFVGKNGDVHDVAVMEYNDGSLEGVGKYSLFLSEV